jgi:DNA-binding NarL/FixJ family response regulator
MENNILIVEDEPLIAKDIEIHLRKSGFNPIGIAHSSDRALDMLHSRKVDLVLLDIHIEGQKNGIDIAEIINTKYSIPFIFLTSFSDEMTLDKAKKTNPSGYIVKPFDENDLRTSITIALHNFKSTKQEGQFCKQMIDKKANTPLSEREYNIILALSDGNNTTTIAETQFISVNTVKFHLKNIYQKLNVGSRAELMTKVLK